MSHVKPIEEYINNYLKDYSPEQLEAVRKMRTECEPMTFEMWQFLVRQQNTVERFIKLKRPRTLWVNEDGEIFYTNHYTKSIERVGKFKQDEE